MPPSGGPHIRDPPQDRDGGQRGGISRDAAFFDRERHPSDCRGAQAMALHWTPACGVAQCRHLLGARQLPPPRDQSGDVPHRHAPPTAQPEDYRHRRPVARALATPINGPRLTLRHWHFRVSGSRRAARLRVVRRRARLASNAGGMHLSYRLRTIRERSPSSRCASPPRRRAERTSCTRAGPMVSDAPGAGRPRRGACGPSCTNARAVAARPR